MEAPPVPNYFQLRTYIHTPYHWQKMSAIWFTKAIIKTNTQIYFLNKFHKTFT